MRHEAKIGNRGGKKETRSFQSVSYTHLNPDADQPAVNLAAEELSEAIANLDLVNPPAEVDKSGLKDAVNRAETLRQEGYTDSSWRWFQSALEEAKACLLYTSRRSGGE